ncbi:YhcG family protein [Helicobacter sp. MIT 01-3238]|uniref:PDDEXK nuclease domain-containing protein n=1 Tax=Helicobacter sp. MIT 01-3238 TaxID=398627 RepID=UPI000E1F92BA|nr:PDDEXK nuclease domain-containing protein [Helicobacter sp. MIT 01-3238]RDU51533.1 DUF1016 domain-containing protein [Helicobacter sp. MIT 01-3238]
MKNITTQNADFKYFVEEIKSKIHSAHASALKAVNKELIALYSDIGKIIVQRQERFGWGKSVVERLSKELQSEIDGLSGFSPQNLWNMRQYYLTYKDNEILQTLSREISWSHNVLIFQKCKDDLQKEFYIKSTLKHAWSYRVLDNHIDNQTYEKSLLPQNNFKSTLPQNLSAKATLILKDEYTFDFLSLNDEHSERELELALIKQVREFLTQMGSEYAFMGNQYKLEADGQEFFIDLLLYHRGLKSLIAIELKIGAFKPEYAGKMNFYLSLLNDKVRLNDENPSIGIIICKDKSKTIVEYALKNTTQPIGVATYTLTKTLPKDLAKRLPTSKEIEKKLRGFFDE